MASVQRKTSTTTSRVSKTADQPVWLAPMPLFVGALLLIFGLVAGFFLHAVFFPPQLISSPPVSDENPLSIQMIFHPDCKLCPFQSSFELLLSERNVAFEVERVDATTAMGSQLVSEFGLDSFPSVLIKADALASADPALFGTLQAKFRLSNGFLVMPERDLIPQTKVLTGFMLKNIPNGVSCSVPSDKVLVWEFGDLFERATFDAFSYTQKLWNDFNQDLEYDFKYWTFSALESERAAIADACAQSSGVFEAYHKILLEKRFLYSLPIDSLAEQQNAANQAGLSDKNAFLACIDNKTPRSRVAFQMGTDSQLAKSYGLTQIPVYIIDCRFVVLNPVKLKESVCRQHPDFAACEGV